MTTIKHPVWRGVVRDVPESDVDGWVKSGWFVVAPKVPGPGPTIGPSPAPKRRRTRKTSG